MMNLITIDCDEIKDWNSFHSIFASKFGFPEFYGKNMNAWIDCMSSLSEPEDGMTKVHCKKGECIALNLHNIGGLKNSNIEIYEALIEGAAFVNFRLIEVGEPPVLALSYYA